MKSWHSRNEFYPVLCYYVSKSLFINVLILRMIYLGMFSMCSPGILAVYLQYIYYIHFTSWLRPFPHLLLTLFWHRSYGHVLQPLFSLMWQKSDRGLHVSFCHCKVLPLQLKTHWDRCCYTLTLYPMKTNGWQKSDITSVFYIYHISCFFLFVCIVDALMLEKLDIWDFQKD